MNTTHPSQPVQEHSRWSSFYLLLAGQVVSLLGSSMTAFGLDLWVLEQTDSALLFTTMIFFTIMPGIVVGIFAGALVDRWDRRLVLIGADALSALVTLGVLLLFAFDVARIGHLYVAVALFSVLGAFQIPAFEAVVAALVAEQDYESAYGLVEMGSGAVQVAAPLLAGLLLAGLGLTGLIVIDLASFAAAVGTLALLSLPAVSRSPEGAEGEGNILQEAVYGWRYATQRPGFLILVLFNGLLNFITGLVLSVYYPLIFSLTPDSAVVGRVVSFGLAGAIAGSLLITTWGGFKRRVYTILLGSLLGGTALLVAGMSRTLLPVALAGFVYWVAVTIERPASRALVASRVPADLRGRVFSAMRVVSWSSLPPAFLLSGLLVDTVMTDLFALDGPLRGTLFEALVGVGEGRGVAFMFFIGGLLVFVTVGVVFSLPRFRRLEVELPPIQDTT